MTRAELQEKWGRKYSQSHDLWADIDSVIAAHEQQRQEAEAVQWLSRQPAGWECGYLGEPKPIYWFTNTVGIVHKGSTFQDCIQQAMAQQQAAPAREGAPGI